MDDAAELILAQLSLDRLCLARDTNGSKKWCGCANCLWPWLSGSSSTTGFFWMCTYCERVLKIGLSWEKQLWMLCKWRHHSCMQCCPCKGIPLQLMAEGEEGENLPGWSSFNRKWLDQVGRKGDCLSRWPEKGMFQRNPLHLDIFYWVPNFRENGVHPSEWEANSVFLMLDKRISKYLGTQLGKQWGSQPSVSLWQMSSADTWYGRDTVIG